MTLRKISSDLATQSPGYVFSATKMVCFQLQSVRKVVCYERVCYEHGLL